MLLEKIKQLCEKNGTNIAKLERELGFGVGTIRKWNTVSPSVSNLKKVADYFHISIDELLTNEA